MGNVNFDQFEDFEDKTNSYINQETADKIAKSIEALSKVLINDDGSLVDLSDRLSRSRMIQIIETLYKKVGGIPLATIDENSAKWLNNQTSTLKESLETAILFQRETINYANKKQQEIISFYKEAQEINELKIKWFKTIAIITAIGTSILLATFFYCIPTYKNKYEQIMIAKENKALKEENIKLRDLHNTEIQMLLFVKNKTTYPTKTWKEVKRNFPNIDIHRKYYSIHNYYSNVMDTAMSYLENLK